MLPKMSTGIIALMSMEWLWQDAFTIATITVIVKMVVLLSSKVVLPIVPARLVKLQYTLYSITYKLYCIALFQSFKFISRLFYDSGELSRWMSMRHLRLWRCQPNNGFNSINSNNGNETSSKESGVDVEYFQVPKCSHGYWLQWQVTY